MTKHLSRIVALILIPCLAGDPVTVMGNEIPIAGGHRGPPLQIPFNSQALAPMNPEPFPSFDSLPALPEGAHPPTEKERPLAQTIRIFLVKDNSAFANIPIVIGKRSAPYGPGGLLATAADASKTYPLVLVADIDWSSSVRGYGEDDLELALRFFLWHEEFHFTYWLPQIEWQKKVAREIQGQFYPGMQLPRAVDALVFDAMTIQHNLRAHRDAMKKLQQGHPAGAGFILRPAEVYLRDLQARYAEILGTLTKTLIQDQKITDKKKRQQLYKPLHKRLEQWLAEPGKSTDKTQNLAIPRKPPMAARNARGLRRDSSAGRMLASLVVGALAWAVLTGHAAWSLGRESWKAPPSPPSLPSLYGGHAIGIWIVFSQRLHPRPDRKAA